MYTAREVAQQIRLLVQRRRQDGKVAFLVRHFSSENTMHEKVGRGILLTPQILEMRGERILADIEKILSASPSGYYSINMEKLNRRAAYNQIAVVYAPASFARQGASRALHCCLAS